MSSELNIFTSNSGVADKYIKQLMKQPNFRRVQGVFYCRRHFQYRFSVIILATSKKSRTSN